MDDRYFTEEINYLLELGKEFSRKHPQKAQMLHFDDVRSREPNVERILESFAFLTSRIRKRLDSDFPQIADGLFSTMWPGYINPIPSFSLLEFQPSLWDFAEAVVVPKGALVDADPIDEIQCRFRTCYDAVVFPLEMSQARVASEGSAATLELTLGLAKDVNLDSFVGNPLQLQLVGDPAPCWQIYDLLVGRNGKRRFVDRVVVEAFNSDQQMLGAWQFGPDAVKPVGLTADEILLAREKNPLWSFELLRDLFLFPEKYQAVRLDIFGFFAGLEGVERLTVKVHLLAPWPSNLKVGKEQLRPNTVPIVNLFAHDTNPIRLSDMHRQYQIEGDSQHPDHYQIYAIDHVESIEVNTNARRLYEPRYTSHSNAVSDAEQGRYYAIERSRAAWGGFDTHIRFFSSDADSDFAREEIVSINATCTNGRLPAKLLVNQIHFPISHVDQRLKLRNITPPTQYIIPDIEGISLWRWLSHAALNYMSIHSTEQLKSLLTLHDFSNADANRRKIAAIKSVEMKTTRTLFEGALMPGISVRLTLEEKGFVDRGEIQLFALVLSVFMSMYATVNSYVQLTVVLEPGGHRIELPPRVGENYPV